MRGILNVIVKESGARERFVLPLNIALADAAAGFEPARLHRFRSAHPAHIALFRFKHSILS